LLFLQHVIAFLGQVSDYLRSSLMLMLNVQHEKD
jgi:hypothetical protein